ncbi:MAG TPA: circularly permuted type 2 ATP-grasp protein, partial [Polyangia bacterium]|nr:circularly permuted type 2 ATP-grasp protein [Polyangia bacterium]
MSAPSLNEPETAGPASDYAPPPGAYDEFLGPDGQVRPHWRPFLNRLRTWGPAEMERRWREARHLIHENGVSYNVYGDERGMERPWSLSPVPVLVAADEWASLATSVTQRARLMDRLLADLYGPQRALVEGWLPAEVVFRNPSFLRPLHGVAVPRGRWLPLYGVDVVRGPDGRFRALADRTQAPTGAGYALENRIVVARALPDLFRECNVERLALFFRTLQDTLARLAPHNRDNPRVVLLTPGPHNASYFEQAYLAQYLGYTLAGGGDLTVRDDRVYLKTLSGLQPVDVILRRVNDDFCDPLELRPETVLGVPGLVQAVRQGSVALANPLGSSLIQTPAILPYLPVIARHLLGEELQLPSVETFWCGDPKVLPVVLERFSHLVLKPAFPSGATHPVFVSVLSAEERAAWRARVVAAPHDWVAMEHVVASTTPKMEADKLVPRSMVLRTYAVAQGGGSGRDGYAVMPGGLARVANTVDNPEVSMQSGAGSKDVWVPSTGPVSRFSLLPSDQRVELTRGGSDLPSRTADDLYWLGRYAERAEGIARLARVFAARLREAPRETPGLGTLQPGSELGALYRALVAETELQVPTTGPVEVGHPLPVVEEQLLATLLDASRPGSFAAVAQKVLRTARMVRDRLSADTWRVLMALDDLRVPEGTDGAVPIATAAALLDRMVLALAAFAGLATESMTRGQAWRFVDMGRRIERAGAGVLLLESTLVEPLLEREAPLLEALLDVADSGMTYRRRYRATLLAAPVLDLLLTDDTNPRSVIFQLRS